MPSLRKGNMMVLLQFYDRPASIRFFLAFGLCRVSAAPLSLAKKMPGANPRQICGGAARPDKA